MANSLSGTVTTGLGKAALFLSSPAYTEKFEEQLGYKPYPGTLNIEVDTTSKEDFLSGLKSGTINSFFVDNKEMGGIDWWAAKIDQQKVHIIRPHKTTHSENIIEVISPISLKESLGLAEGESVTLLQP